MASHDIAMPASGLTTTRRQSLPDQASEPSPPDVEKTIDEPLDHQAMMENPPVRKIHGLRWGLVCVALYSSCVLYGLDTTIAADVQGPVVESLGNVELLAWVGAGFPLGSVAVITFLGNLYATFNVKRIFIISVITFEVGSALCGAAPNMGALIVGRVIAGAGGSGIYLGSLTFVAHLTVPAERGLYMSMIGFFWGVGAILGPIVGGAFAVSAATWRWAFYINLVIGGITAPAYLFALQPIHPGQPGVSVYDRVMRLDFFGFLLSAAVWTFFLLAFTMAGGQWAWNDQRTIATFVAFGMALLLFVLQQYFSILTTPARRSFPGHLLRQRAQVLLYVTTAAGITALYVVIYFIPIYFQFVNSDTALMAAVRLLPYVIIAISVNLMSGYLLSALKYYMLLYVTAGTFLIVGGALMVVFLRPEVSTGIIYGISVVIAVGSGMVMLSGYAVASLVAKPEDTGAALSMQNMSQIGGQVIALAIAGQIFQSTAIRNLEAALGNQGFSAQEIKGAVAGAQSALFQRLHGDLRDAAISAVTDAMQRTFLLVPIAGAVLLIAGLCMKREKLLASAGVPAGG